jgi:TP901 family phage tail tape measure protein
MRKDVIETEIRVANKAQKDIAENEQQIRSLKDANRALKKEMTELVATGQKNSERFKNLDKEYKNNNKTITDLGRKTRDLEKTLGLQNLTMAQLQRRAQDLTRQMNSTARNLHPEEYKKLANELGAVRNYMGKLKDEARETSKTLGKTIFNRGSLATATGNILSQTFNHLGSALRNAFALIKDFEQANANLASILGVSRKEITLLTEQAKQLGATTEYTASQVSGLQVELAKLGFTQGQISDMTKDVLSFATATGAELPAAAALAGAAMRAFGLEAGDMNRVVSAMAVGTTKSALSFSYLEAAMSTVAPVAKTFGFTIEDTVALLGTLANSGFDASSAATATRNILLNLADSGGKLAQALGRPVKTLDDLVPAFAELKAKGVDLNETLELTDKRSVAAFNTFLDSAKSIGTLRDSVTGAGDALQKMVDERINTVEGSIKIMQSAWEGLMLAFSSSTGPVKTVIDGVTSILTYITQLVTGEKKLHSGITATIKAIVYLTTVGAAYWAGLQLQTLWNARLALSVAATNTGLKAKQLLLKLLNADLAKHNILIAASRSIYLLFTAALSALTGKITTARAAMRLFNQTFKANPFGLVLSAISAVVLAFTLFRKRLDEISESTKSLESITRKVSDEFTAQEAHIRRLNEAIRNSNLSNETRIAALKELKEIIPGYNGELSAEGKLINDNTDAIKEYLKQLEKQLKLKAAQDELEDLYRRQRLAEKELTQKESAAESAKPKTPRSNQASMYGGAYDRGAGWERYDKLASSVHNAKKELESLNEAIKDVNGEIEKSDYLTAPGNTPAAPGTGGDKDKKNVEKRLKDINTNLEAEISLLKQRRLEGLDTERQYNKKVNALTIESLQQKIAVKGQERDQLVKYESQIRDLELKMKEETGKEVIERGKVTAEAEKADVSAIQKSREEDLQNRQNVYNKAAADLNQALADKKITKQQHEMMMLGLDKGFAERRLEIEQEYYAHAQSLQMENAELKVKLVKETGQQVIEAEKAVNDARLAEQTKLNDLIKDFKAEFKVTTVEEDHTAQLTVLEASYRARKEMAEQNNLDAAELDKAYLRAKEQLQQEHEDRLYAIRNQYGLVNLQEEYDMELLQLQTHLNQKMLTQEQYEKALQNLKRNSVKKQFDYYKSLFSDAVNALQNAEIANIDAKYDVEIEAAKGNADEVARLEEEKAQKKLDVEKKFADVNFAIKAAQIIADTAVGMMSAFQLGPVAGAIAAALIGVTGVAQLAAANAERQKVKNMTLTSSGSSSSNKTGARVASGREEGGKIDIIREQDGKYFPDADYDPDRRGYVDRPTVIVGEGPAGQSREWVASNAAITNPTVAPVLDMVDKAQQAGMIRSFDLNAAMRARAAGYADGGIIDKSPAAAPDRTPAAGLSITTDELVSAFIQALSKAEFTAPVVLSELEARKKRLDVSRSIGTKR